jgi:hypothetical protein
MKKDHRFTVLFFVFSVLWAFAGLYYAHEHEFYSMVLSLGMLAWNGVLCAKCGYEVTIWNLKL